MKYLVTLIFAFLGIVSQGQFTDDFSDGNFSVNPQWLGENTHFIIDNNQRLRLNAPEEEGRRELYTKSFVGTDAIFEFDIFFDFNPSSVNYTEVYLMADDIPSKAKNALFLKIGGLNDRLELYTIENGDTDPVLYGNDDLTDVNPVELRVKLEYRNDSCLLYSDLNLTDNYTLEGVFESELKINSKYFGVIVNHSSTRAKLTAFDNFNVTGELENFPPELISYELNENQDITLIFNENIASPLESDFIIDGTSPNSISHSDNEVTLFYDNDFEEPSLQILSINNIEDEIGNKAAEITQEIFFGNISEPGLGDISINEIMADPNPVQGLPDAEYIELVNNTGKAFRSSSLRLFNDNTEQNLRDFILLPNSYIVLCDDDDLNKFLALNIEPISEIGNFTTLSNNGDSLTLLNSNGEIIDLIQYYPEKYDENKKSGGYSIERINPKKKCLDPYEFDFSINETGGTPGFGNSILDTTDINYSAQIIDISLNSYDSTLQFILNQSLDLSAVNLNHFSFNNLVPDSFSLMDKRNQYFLKFSDWPNPLNTYNFEIKGATNCFGIETNATAQVYVPQNSLGDELVITEIMADPTPANYLPEVEYIEIYNRSAYPVNTADFQFKNTNTFLDLPSYTVNPNEYLIIINRDDSSYFKNNNISYIGLPSFPTLSNAGDSLGIYHPRTEKLEAVSYNLSYYQNKEKEDGGYSIESLNPNNNCLGFSNFMASEDSIGGTPGKQNSVFDNGVINSPKILGVEQIQTNYTITWDRNLYSDNLSEAISIEPNAIISNLIVEANLVSFSLSGLNNNNTYTLSFNGFEDCKNNIANETYVFTSAKIPEKGELIITEILADPSPALGLPEVEYFEIYNRSTNTLDLSTLHLNNKAIPNNIILNPKQYLVIGSGALNVYNTQFKYLASPEISSTFLTNAGKNIHLSFGYAEPLNEVVSVDYSVDWHNNQDAKTGGVSLELINPELACYNLGSYWVSSENESGGTPGQANSVYLENLPSNKLQYIAYKNEELRFVFNYAVNANESTGDWPNSLIFMGYGPAENVLSFLGDNIKDLSIEINAKNCNSNETITVYTKIPEIKEAENQDLIFNEILFDPEGEVSEYLEIYNKSSACINLQSTYFDEEINGNLGRQIDSTGRLLFPNSYLLLSDDTTSLSQNYSSFNGANFVGSFNLPALSNSGARLVLENRKGEIIDSVYYSVEFHNDWLSETKGVAIERISPENVVAVSNNWTSASEQMQYGTPGSKNSQHANFSSTLDFEMSSDYLSPNGDGYQDALIIEYKSSKPGEIASLYIFDKAGQLIKTVADKSILGDSNQFIWKVDNDQKSKVDYGIYIVLLEIDNASSKARIKKTVTVGQ